jgi:hypothetical protein
MRQGRIKHHIIYFISAFLITTWPVPTLKAQIFRNYYNQEVKLPAEPQTLSLSVNGSTFFNNNEFFGTNVEGYTLTGAFFQPELNYSVTGNLNAGVGIHLMKYNGRKEFAQVLPLFRLDYRVSESFRITMGSFNGGEAFLLPEPLYKFENHFTSLVNNGIRLDYHSGFLKSLTWINWENFILQGDSLQEQFTFGSSDIATIMEGNGNRIEIPIHILVHHQGGQINNTDKPVITTFNLGAGFKLDHDFGNGERGGAFFNPMFFYESSDESETHGVAWYPRAGIRFDPFSLTAGYFRGSHFNSIHGEPLFISPDRSPNITSDDATRSLITFKAGVAKRISESSSILLRFEGYYDTALKKLQYTYGMHIILNESFILGKFQK